jgi:hypothetical protein
MEIAMTETPLPSNVIRFPVERVRMDRDVLNEIAPDFYEHETMAIRRDGGECCTLDTTSEDAELETLPMIEALDRSDPVAYRTALKAIVDDAVKEAIPLCRAFRMVEQEYFVRMQRHEKNPDSGFFERMFEDYIPTYEGHLEAAYQANKRVLGISRAVCFARDGQPWQPRGKADSEWLIAAETAAQQARSR